LVYLGIDSISKVFLFLECFNIFSIFYIEKG
jgi:hypothetical protein